MFHSLIIAFAMYSKIPMPRVDWNEKNMKYVMGVFPLVGAVMGLIQAGVFLLLEQLGFGDVFRSAILAVLPVLITGGIHMDGLMDTADALNSWGDREKKLAILKDSHTGAFAILACVMYFILWMAVWSESGATWQILVTACCCFFFSRCLSGLGVTLFQCAKNSGLAHTFHSAAQKKTTKYMLLVQLILCSALMIAVKPVCGVCEIAAGLAVFGYYRWFSYKEFGGINGDMAGYFLSLCELAMVAVTAVLPHVVP